MNDKKSRKICFILMVIGWVLLLIRIFAIDGAKDDLIVKYHYSGYNALHIVFCVLPYICFGVALGLAAYRLIMGIHMNKADKERAKMQEAERRKRSLETPEGVYEYASQLHDTALSERKALPHVDSTVEKAIEETRNVIAQLDCMNEIQRNLVRLLELNNVTKLDETKDLLQDIENAICMTNVKKLINYYVVGGWEEFLVYSGTIIGENRGLLDEAQGVLDDTTKFVNGGKSLDDVKARVRSFRNVISKFIEEE